MKYDKRGSKMDMISTLVQDIRYGIRMLVKAPGFTVVAIIALALGIGANSAIFSLVNAVLLRDLPYKTPDSLLMVWENDTQEGNPRNAVAPANLIDFRARNEVFDRLEFYTQPSGITLTDDSEPERVEIAGVSAGLLSVLGTEPMLGRNFLPEEEVPGANRVVIITHGLWQRRFGSDPNFIGNTLKLDGLAFSVVGVLRPDFVLPEEVQVLSPKPITPKDAVNREQHYLRVIGRLKSGASLAQANANMASIAGQLEQQYPESNTGRGATLITVKEQFVGDIRVALIVLFGAVAFVLLIACTNVANLLLARGAARQKEMAIRMALGASRGRVIRQLLAESILLSILGGGVGLLVAVWGSSLFLSLGPASLVRVGRIGIDPLVLVFTLTLSLLTGVVFGLLPAFQVSKPNLNEVLKEAGRGSTEGLRLNRLGRFLVISELGLSVALLVGAGLMVKSFVRLQEINPGFDSNNILTLQISLPSTRYREPQQVSGFYRQLTERVEALPGVKLAGVVSRLPLAGDRATTSLIIEGRPQSVGELSEAHYRVITPSYFRVLGIPLLRGREFTEQDSQSTPAVVMINQNLARTYWPDENPVGKRVRTSPNSDSPWYSIVGVVGDARNFGLDAEARHEIYASYLQDPSARARLVIRTASDPERLVGAVRGEVQAIDKDLAISQVSTMETLIANSVSQRRLNILLLSIFAGVALILASIGIYGVISYSVSQRTHEMGIRLALGARPLDIIKLIVTQGAKLAIIGVAIGLAVAFALTRVLVSLLYGVSATDPVIFLAMSGLLVAVALLACYIPARRAAKVDPMVALRFE
jgi:putative ABC transport system permease protein